MSRRPSPRMRKVNELLREVLADEVRNLKDPGIGFVTITGVDTSPDLRNAIVFFSALGTDEEQRATERALRRAAPHLQGTIGRNVRLKYTPALQFRRDASIDEGIRIHEILHRLEDEGGATSEDEAGAAGDA